MVSSHRRQMFVWRVALASDRRGDTQRVAFASEIVLDKAFEIS